LINPAVTGIIGSGVVVHVPSFFEEFDTLRDKGNSRLFRTLISCLADAEQDWIPLADFSFPIERISSLTSTRSWTG
jgi:adenylosuccinate synthase